MSSSQFNRPAIVRQSYPAPSPYYNSNTERWDSNSNSNQPQQQQYQNHNAGWSSYPQTYPYHSQREGEYRQPQAQSHSFPPINCSPEFYSTDRQLHPNPYPSPEMGSDQQLAGTSRPNERSLAPLLPQQQVDQYETIRRSPPVMARHDPYRRPEVHQRVEPERNIRNSERMRDGPVRPFASKVAYMLKTPEKFGEAVRWDASGTTFILTLSNPLLYEMLTEMFSHKSLAAFTHQLNTYGFSRLTAAQMAHRFDFEPDPRLLKSYSAWSHPYFTRGDSTTLNRLIPKPSKARATQQKEKAMRILMGQQNDSRVNYN